MVTAIAAKAETEGHTRRAPRVAWRQALGLVAFLAADAYVGICAYVAEKVTRPTRLPPLTTPTDFGLQYEDVEFPSTVDNTPISAWYINSPGDKVIVMMHGRGGRRDDPTIGTMEIAQALVAHNYDVLMFDFRAHGFSGGTRYSMGWNETRDVAGAVNYLKSRGIDTVGVLAFSMGAATALLAAPDHPEIQALVTDSAYADLSRLLSRALPAATGLPAFFNPGILLMGRVLFGVDVANTRPIDRAKLLKERPWLLIHSADDEAVPLSQAYDFEQAVAGNPNFRMWVAPACLHCRAYLMNREEYLRRVISFFDENL